MGWISYTASGTGAARLTGFAEGTQADEKFIERAVHEHVDEYGKILKREIDRELKGL